MSTARTEFTAGYSPSGNIVAFECNAIKRQAPSIPFIRLFTLAFFVILDQLKEAEEAKGGWIGYLIFYFEKQFVIRPI
jgi:hypothetical protein